MRPQRPQPGFTLIELTLVMVILAVVLAIVAPSLGRMRARTRVDDSAAQVRSLIELARTRAVTDGRPTRVVIDTTEYTCWVEHLEGGGFVRTTASYGRKIELDRGVLITTDDASEDDLGLLTIRAEPDGRAEAVQLTLTGDASGRERVVYARSVTEPYRIGDADDAALFIDGGVYVP